jgi:hypothetical protein
MMFKIKKKLTPLSGAIVAIFAHEIANFFENMVLQATFFMHETVT